MLLLFETAAGYALFKASDGKVENVEDLHKQFQTAESAQKIVSLKKFHSFSDTTEALQAATALQDSSLSEPLRKFLKKNIVDANVTEKLLVAEAKLGGTIKKELGVECRSDAATMELMRCIRSQLDSLLSEVSPAESRAMSLGLAHNLSRFKLKFSPDKIDTMVIQAISLLDDLDKEINIYAMRVREWYGWHFPELSAVVNDNMAYARVVKLMGSRNHALDAALDDVLTPEIAAEVRKQAQISMGTEVSEADIANIRELCDQVLDISQYREQLYDYLRNRMQAIAPNLTVLVGELVGARLVAHAGSLLALAKYPASTIQILGAEKALFRALKTKAATPKYGLIYHASLVGQTTAKNKGKISRVLAAKCSLSIRVDALSDATVTPQIGVDDRVKVEKRVRTLDGGVSLPSQAKIVAAPTSYAVGSQLHAKYNAAADTTIETNNNNNDDDDNDNEDTAADNGESHSEKKDKKKKKKEKKEKKEKSVKKEKKRHRDSDAAEADGDSDAAVEEKPKKRKHAPVDE